jgi:serine/threonine protein kinase
MAPSVNVNLPPGHICARYTIEKRVAAGGFGVVYTALREDGQRVALKEFLPAMLPCRLDKGATKITLKSPQDQRRFDEGLASFFREADTLAHLSDPGIIQIWDVFEANGTAYFAMPLEKGGTLQSWVRQGSHPPTELQLRDIFVQAARGVEAMHAAGLLHLDIKPSNLWVRPDGKVLVLDLGASRWNDDAAHNARMARTPGFAAPEQHGIKGDGGQMSVKTDIYGLSASLYSCLEGHPPKPAPGRSATDLPYARHRLGQRSSEILKIVDRGMQLAPSLRHESAAVWLEELEAIPRLDASVFVKDKLSLSAILD